MSSRRNRHSRGQALVEFAITVPVLLFFVMITVDVGRAYWQSIDASGAARAGARMGIISDTSDIGDAVREEPNSGIPNTTTAWGNEGPGQPYGVCTSNNVTCGDPSGCVSSTFSGTQIACFAIRVCNQTGGGDLGTCSSYGTWGIRPDPGGGHALEVLVVIKFSAATPALTQLVPSGNLYLSQSVIAEQVYF
jgi:hypothetical protein